MANSTSNVSQLSDKSKLATRSIGTRTEPPMGGALDDLVQTQYCTHPELSNPRQLAELLSVR